MKCLGYVLTVAIAIGFLETAAALDRRADTGGPVPAMEQHANDALAVAVQPISYSLADVAGVTTGRDRRPALAVAGGTQIERSVANAASRAQTGSRSESPGAEAPGPAGWVTLLCVAIVAAFMAWRKARWLAG